MTDPTERIETRAALERLLLEHSAFSADAADIAGIMVIFDTFSAEQAVAMSQAPSAVVESHLHTLRQQAELLLDSGAAAARLSDRIGELLSSVDTLTEVLSVRIEQVAASLQELTVVVAGHLAAHDQQPVFELTDEMREAVREGLEPAEVATAITQLTEGLDDPAPQSPPIVLADWERDLLEGRIGAGPDPEQGIRYTEGGDIELFCRHCRRWKPTDRFFRNAKSDTGHEKKCKDCAKRHKNRRAA